jgi:2'-5' RNA ligase
MSSTDHRLAAHAHVESLITLLTSQPDQEAVAPLIEECRSLARAIQAFHMEGIRFRMFNVDRLLARPGAQLPEAASRLFAETRQELEEAGFHTRSHQAPG